jgi:methylated-DNA-[protein]-cysteine S-methyltransferase
VRAQLTQYAVARWGEGELWTANGTILANDFRFSEAADARAEDVDAFERDVVERCAAFLTGEDVRFDDLRLDLESATPFQLAVVDALRAIPRGEVVAYGELAALAGYPRAGRAVGNICAHNPWMLIVPCHRVVASTGIGRYGSAGVAVKRRLLALEGIHL